MSAQLAMVFDLPCRAQSWQPGMVETVGRGLGGERCIGEVEDPEENEGEQVARPTPRGET